MPELSDSNPPPNPVLVAMLRDSAVLTPPPGPGGFPWEEHHAFRFAFLLNFTQAGDREALEHLGNRLYEMALECAGRWPDWPESPTKAQMRAAARDLHHAAAFLASVGAERHHASLDLEDEGFCAMAGTWAHMVAQIARGIESVLPRVPGTLASQGGNHSPA